MRWFPRPKFPRTATPCALRTILAFVSLALAVTPSRGQESDPEWVPPAPETIVLRTRDGVVLQATYYAGPKKKQTPVVLLLHDEKSNRSKFAELAKALQEGGYSVLAPDLRGFGGSTEASGNRRIHGARLAPDEYLNMVRYDLEALRRFLLERNNAGELNLSRLGVVATGMSTPVALIWAHNDWGIPPLATGKQGQDVQALALVSPQWRAGNARIEAVVGQGEVLRSVDMLIAVGGAHRDRHVNDADRLHDALVRSHTRARTGRGPAGELAIRRYKTSLQGAAMLGERLGLEEDLVEFLHARLANPDVEWTERKKAF